MTIGEAIMWLAQLERIHGPKVVVFFDCPRCLQSFTPGIVVTQAVHLATSPQESK